MKKLLFLLLSFGAFFNAFSSSVTKPASPKATEIFIPLGKDMKISLMDLSQISVKDFQRVTHKHLDFIDRLSFKAGQRKLRSTISRDGTINNKKLLKFLNDGDSSTGFHVLGFALGFLLGLLGVLIAYVIGGDEDIKKNRTKWAWIGCAVLLVFYLILIAAFIGSVNRIG